MPRLMSSDQPSQEQLSAIPKKVSLHSQLPNFKDVNTQQKIILFITKVRQCNRIVSQEDQDLKKLKHAVLYSLLDHINNQNNAFPPEGIPDFFNMVNTNIFRQAPKPQAENEDVYEPDDDQPVVDPQWYHLQFVYELLLRFIYSYQTGNSEYQKIIKKYIDADFVIKLIQLFNQSDPRERDYVKTLLHRIYANFMALRSYIRAAIKSELQTYLISQQHNGICDLLEVLGSIINGFATPLKAEHIQFLNQCLLPLHKVLYIKNILPQLSYCISKYIEKDPTLSGYIIYTILTTYPRLSSQKEIQFLSELEELLEMIPTNQLLIQSQESRSVKLPPAHRLFLFAYLFEIIAQAICSLNFLVAEKAVNIVQNPKIIKHVRAAQAVYNLMYGEVAQLLEEDEELNLDLTMDINPSETKPKPHVLNAHFDSVFVLSRALRINSKHWNQQIRSLSDQALKALQQSQTEATDDLDLKILQAEVSLIYKKSVRETAWSQVAQMARTNVPKFSSYFQRDTVVDLNNIDTINQVSSTLDEFKKGFVPGYESEVIEPEVIQSCEVPEDPLFCRVEELSFPFFGCTNEQIQGAIDGLFLDHSKLNADKLDEEQTACDAAYEKKIPIFEESFQVSSIETISQALIKGGYVTIDTLVSANVTPQDQTASLLTVSTKLPKGRLANRRASAGVQQLLGIRRKSVTPINIASMAAKEELSGFVKHDVIKSE